MTSRISETTAGNVRNCKGFDAMTLRVSCAPRLSPVVSSVSGALHARNSGVVITSSAFCSARSQNSTFS